MRVNIDEKLAGWLTPAVGAGTYPSEWYKHRLDNIRSIVNQPPMERTLSLLHYYFGSATDTQKEEVDKLIQGEDLAFPRGQHHLNRLLTGACLIELLNSRSHSADAIALGASTFSLQGMLSKIEDDSLAAEFYVVADAYLQEEMQLVRPKKDEFESVADYNKKVVSSSAIKKTIETIMAPETTNKHQAVTEVLTEMLDYMAKVQSEVAERVSAVISAYNGDLTDIETQLSILREESNLLWWLFGEQSRSPGILVRSLTTPAVATLFGKEAADLTQILPGHAAVKGILAKAIALHTASRNAEKVKDAEFGEYVDFAVPDAATSLNTPELPKVDKFCHFHRALKAKRDISGGDWKKNFEAMSLFRTDLQLTPINAAHQMYQESLLMRTVKLDEAI